MLRKPVFLTDSKKIAFGDNLFGDFRSALYTFLSAKIRELINIPESLRISEQAFKAHGQNKVVVDDITRNWQF